MLRTLTGIAVALAMSVPTVAAAGEPPAGWQGRVFVTVAAGVQTASPAFNYDFATTLFAENASAGLRIPGRTGPTFDIGGGVRVARNFGVGLTYSRYSRSRTALLTTTIPSPLVFGDSATIERRIPLQRDEDAFHIQAMYRVPLASRLEVGVFGGPTYFRCLDDTISTFSLEGDFSPAMNWLVRFRNVTRTVDRDTAWGYNAGADVTYMATPHIGFGATFRFSRASHQTPNLLSDVSNLTWDGTWGGDQTTTTVTMRHGGMHWNGGVTFRF
jgi:hypothetical protein